MTAYIQPPCPCTYIVHVSPLLLSCENFQKLIHQWEWGEVHFFWNSPLHIQLNLNYQDFDFLDFFILWAISFGRISINNLKTIMIVIYFSI